MSTAKEHAHAKQEPAKESARNQDAGEAAGAEGGEARADHAPKVTHGSGHEPALAPIDPNESILDVKGSDGLTERERTASVRVGDEVHVYRGSFRERKLGRITKVHNARSVDVSYGDPPTDAANVLCLDGHPPSERAARVTELQHADPNGVWVSKLPPSKK